MQLKLHHLFQEQKRLWELLDPENLYSCMTTMELGRQGLVIYLPAGIVASSFVRGNESVMHASGSVM
jgi:hypothetical protein